MSEINHKMYENSIKHHNPAEDFKIDDKVMLSANKQVPISI